MPNLSLVPGRVYYFGVKAQNGAGLWSDEGWSDGITCKRIVYVDRSATGTPDGTTWQRAYHGLATALSNATAGKEIWVAKGTFSENIMLKSQVGLYGSFAGGESIRTDVRDWTGNLTVIDGGDLGPVVVVPQNVLTPTVIDGFTIQNGQAAQYYTYNRGGGIFCDEGGDAWITHNIIQNNFANVYGGGIACYLASPWIAYNTITNNEAYNWDGGGIHCYGGSPWIFQNEITSNMAGQNYRGAGIATFGGSPTIEDNLISGNYRFASGGGIYCEGGSYWIIDNRVQDNKNPLPDTTWPAGDGGGVCCNGGTDVFVTGNTITGNQIAGGSGHYGGAGIYLYACTGAATDNTITSNCFRKSGYNGGGADIRDCTSAFEFSNNTVENNSTYVSSGNGGGGGGIYCTGGSPLIARNTVSGNTGYTGGSISVVTTNATVERNRVENNTSPNYGGGILYSGVTGNTYNPTIRNNVVRSNTTTGAGGGLWLGAGTALVVNNTVTGNSASGNGGGIYCAYSSSSPTIVNCIVYNNSFGIYANQCTPVHHHNCVTLNSGGDYSSNLSRGATDLAAQTNPALATDGIHLSQGSPCVDVGDDTLAPSNDYDGDGRPLDGDTVPGAVSDIGADELVP